MATQPDLTARLATCPAECWTFQGRDTSPCTLEQGHEGSHLTGWPGNKFEQVEADEVAAWRALELVCKVAGLEVVEA